MGPCAKFEMARNVMPMSYYSETNDAAKIGTLCRLIDTMACFRMDCGHLDDAVDAIRFALRQSAINQSESSQRVIPNER